MNQQGANPMMNQQGANPMMNQQGANPMMNQQGANPMMFNPMFFGHQMMMNQQMMMNPMMMNPMMMNPMMMNPMMMNPMMNPMMNQQQVNPPIVNPPIVNPIVVQQEYQPFNRHVSIIQAQPSIAIPIIEEQPAPAPAPALHMPNNQEQQIRIENDNGNGEQQLINQFVNVSLINKKQKVKSKYNNDINFKQWSDNRNVIKIIQPINHNDAHFNNKTHPNEKYMVEFTTGNKEELIAFDINEYTLDSHKIIYEHNNSINQDNIKGTSVIYTRTSSPNGISHKTQLDECLKYAKTHSLILTGYHCDDGVSGRHGYNLKNGELGFWTKYINNGTHFIIYSVDRLTRHLLSGINYIDNLVSRNIDIHFVTNKIVYNTNISSMHKSMIQQELQTAEKYSNDTSEKIKGTIKRLKAEGHCVGGRIPYGVKRIVIDGIRKQVPNPNEVDNIKIIKSKYYEIWNNFNKYKNVIKNKSKYQILQYLQNWCNENHIKHRNNQILTINNIKKFIVMKI
jgi:DNA invertase Pin-like site-specific DNA recombinase